MKQFLTILVLVIGITHLAIGQTADFSFTSTTGLYCTPAIIKFTQTTTGNPIGYVWTFGNNTGSNLRNPQCNYTAPGVYSVRLLVIYKKSTLQVSKTVLINPAVTVVIGYDRNLLCKPGIINFNATASGTENRYVWNFGDNSPVVSTTSVKTSHYFTGYGSYAVSVKATSPTGCFARTTSSVTVQRPVISGSVINVSGCVPKSVQFAAAVSLPPASSVSAYTWNFDDGSPSITGTTSNTVHTYSAPGNFIPTLRITTNEGCTNDYSYRGIAFGTAPVNHIAYPKKNIVCGSETPAFVAKAENANKYLWIFGDGDSTYVTDTLAYHKFKTLGTKTIQVIPFYNDCPGLPIQFSIEVIGVISGYKYSNTCSAKKTFTFTNLSQGNLSDITWNFGDGSPSEPGLHAIHVYPDTGTFVTTLSIRDNVTSCIDLYRVNIYTANPSLTNPDSSLCKNAETIFSIPGNYNNPAALYTWSVLGNQHEPNNLAPFTIIANSHGNFHNNAVVINNGTSYCPDTTNMNENILVRGPLLAFNAPDALCQGKSYSITNLSIPYIPTDHIIKWRWDYGIPGQKDSVSQPEPYFYPYWGTYPVTLAATDDKGCTDSLVKNITIYDLPFLVKIPDIDTICAGESALLIAFHNDPITWNPVNSISCNTCDSVLVSPATTTTYFVKATNRFSCTKTDSIQVYVYAAFDATALKTEHYICLNEKVQLGVEPRMNKITWTPAEGLTGSNIFNPVASPDKTTLYKAILTDSVGCFSDSINILVHVSPLPAVEAGANRVLPYHSNFTLSPVYSSNINSYLWLPAQNLGCNNCPNPDGIAVSTQTYTIKVISDSGCIAKDNITIFVECKGANLLLPTAFTPNNDNLNDYFYPIARGIHKIRRFSIFNRAGQKVFEATDLEPNQRYSGWDGTFKGSQQAATAYVYDIEAVCETGEKINQKGSFVLLR